MKVGRSPNPLKPGDDLFGYSKTTVFGLLLVPKILWVRRDPIYFPDMYSDGVENHPTRGPLFLDLIGGLGPKIGRAHV